MLTHTLDHAARAQDRLLEQFKDVDAWAKFLAVWNVQTQDVEDALWDIFEGRYLNGVGAQLDQLGRVLDEPREGFGDAQYLERLKAKILILRSSGAAPDIIKIYKRLLPDNSIVFRVIGGAGFILDIGTINPDYADIYTRFLHEAKSAAINAQLIYTGVVDSGTFAMATGTTVSAGISSGVTSIPVIDSTAPGVVGSLVVLDAGMSVAELGVIANESTGAITLAAVTTHAHAVGAALYALALPSTFAQLSASSSIGATSLTVVSHSFLAGEVITVDPGLPTEEDLTIASATSTVLTLAHAAHAAHASGTYAIAQSHLGFSGLDRPTVGGKLSGIIT